MYRCFGVIMLMLLSISLCYAANNEMVPEQVVRKFLNSANEANSYGIQTGIDKPLQEKDIVSESGDINGDGLLDWLIYVLGSCGSAGCTADVYVADKNGRFCYVGYGDTHNLLRRGKIFPELRCGIIPIREITGEHEPMNWMKPD